MLVCVVIVCLYSLGMTEVGESIPFDELHPNSSVRFTVIDGTQYLSVRDIIMVMCRKNGNRAMEVWARLPDIFKQEVTALCGNFQFKGTGQKEQPVIQFQGAIKLLMWLPGEQAKQFRSQAADILTRYYAGDKNLLKEVWENAQSLEPIHVAARTALPREQVEDETTRKRKAIELAVLEVELRTTQLNIQTRLMVMYASLCPNQELDDRTRLHFKDVIINLSNACAGGGLETITDPPSLRLSQTPPSAPIPVRPVYRTVWRNLEL